MTRDEGAIPMVTVRDYQPDDLDECVALYIRVFGEPPWEETFGWRASRAATRRAAPGSTPSPCARERLALPGFSPK